jgi:hypothetical protein
MDKANFPPFLQHEVSRFGVANAQPFSRFEIAFAFSKASRQIGDASEGSDHLRLVVGPAAERDRYRSPIGT